MTAAPIAGASLALQQAIYAHLTSDVVLMTHLKAVVDWAPDDQPLPFVQLGLDFISDASTKTYFGTEHRITLDIWCESEGTAQAKYLLELVRARLATLETIPGFTLTVWRFGLAQVLRQEDGTSHHGVLEYRARLIAA
jgi:Protein of unknown function (DUF3168)